MNETYKNVLITGGCGRLGRQCYYELHNEYNITLLDRVAPDKQPFPWKPERDCKFVMGELTSLEDCMRAILLSKADCILHLAAITHATEVGRFVYQRDPYCCIPPVGHIPGGPDVGLQRKNDRMLTVGVRETRIAPRKYKAYNP